MDKENINKAEETSDELQHEDAVVIDEVNATPAEDSEAMEETAEGVNSLEAENAKLKEELEKQKKEYLFLMADYDNFRKRTIREKSDLIKNGGEAAFKGLLPIVDDFERAIKASASSEDVASLKEGMELIYKKMVKYLAQNGVKEMDPEDRTFDADRHEAISAVPVPDEEQKGKILDTIEKGYTINDKVLRHAKVVVGQ